MQFLLSVIVVLATDILLLLYLINSEYFSPTAMSGEADTWNIVLFITLVSAGAGLLISLLTYIGEKILFFGWREFPPARRAVKFGLLSAIAIAVLLAMHIFHLLNIVVILVVCVILLIGIIIIR